MQGELRSRRQFLGTAAGAAAAVALRPRHHRTAAYAAPALAEGDAVPVAVVNTGVFNNPFILGTTMPDSTNTGYGILGYTSGTLTDVFPTLANTSATFPGNYVYSVPAGQDGTVLQGMRIHGIVEIAANNVTVQGCEIVGHLNIPYPGTTHYGLISTSGTGTVVQYNTLTQYDATANGGLGQDNSAGGSGTLDTYWPVGVLMTGGTCTVHRNNISNINDANYTTAGTHTVSGNFIHDFDFRNDDADQSTNAQLPFWSHNDGFQIEGGTGHQVIGNNFVMKFSDVTGMNSSGVGAGFNSAGQGTGNPNPSEAAGVEQQWPNCHGVLIQNQKNAVSGVVIQNNWFKYGSVGIRFGGAQAFDPGGANTVTGNRFTPDQGKEFNQYRQIVVDPVGSWSVQPTVDNTNIYSFDSDTPTSPVNVQGQPLNGNPPGNPFTSGTGGAAVTAWMYNSSAHTGNKPFSLTSP